MQSRLLCLALPITLLLVSCASQPIAIAPVGPKPGAWTDFGLANGAGYLQVFTETDEYEWNHDVPFCPHRDYQIYATDGKRLRRVWNSQNHEDETPTVVDLPAGNYLVKADAEFYGPVTVPVVIRPGALTKVILQPGWHSGKSVGSADLVQMPNGYYIGWKADLPTH
jgi:hypothetical protein